MEPKQAQQARVRGNDAADAGSWFLVGGSTAAGQLAGPGERQQYKDGVRAALRHGCGLPAVAAAS